MFTHSRQTWELSGLEVAAVVLMDMLTESEQDRDACRARGKEFKIETRKAAAEVMILDLAIVSGKQKLWNETDEQPVISEHEFQALTEESLLEGVPKAGQQQPERSCGIPWISPEGYLRRQQR